uniref:Synaptoporin-like n=1 Tax=Gouania willdenowi TaxID=441366 RepID=A0A8C5NC91_GOUWI
IMSEHPLISNQYYTLIYPDMYLTLKNYSCHGEAFGGILMYKLKIFAICAFATCGGYSGYLQVKVDCADKRQSNRSINIDFGYPFRLHQVHFKAPLCEAKRGEILFLDGDYSSTAQLFVTVAVFSFMWLISSCCWAKTVSDIKTATNPTLVFHLISACRAQENQCAATHEPHWSRLNCSVVFGFVNLMLWVGNIWFVYKETGWYKTGHRYPTRSASGKRSSEMRQRLYSESSFDQPDEGFGLSRQSSFNQTTMDFGRPTRF